jgi:hypothetical protein
VSANPSRGGALSLVLATAIATAVLLPSRAHASDSPPAPHNMTKADGTLDTETCAVCHTASMDLERSKLETCTLCHAETVHSGAAEHLRAEPQAVAGAIAGRAKDAVPLPLTDDGRIWCGTCHLFHDPKVLSEEWLAHGWIPPDQGLSAAVREGVLGRWARLSEVYDQHEPPGQFATTGTRLLRLTVKDGSLCRQCHAAKAGGEK